MVNSGPTQVQGLHSKPEKQLGPIQGIRIGGVSIEDLFSRPIPLAEATDPNYVFPVFSAEQLRECKTLLIQHPMVTVHNPESEVLKSLTTKPPIFDGRASDSPEQIRFNREFSRAAIALGHSMLDAMLSTIPSEFEVVVAPVWRAGMAFIGDPHPRIDKFLHVGARRDPQTLKSTLYYSTDFKPGNPERTFLFVADPMVGTANAMIDVVRELRKIIGPTLPERNIQVVSMFLAPEGGARILNQFPDIRIHAASIDNSLNERGWVIPDNSDSFLGDFGDCYLPDGLSTERIQRLKAGGVLTHEDEFALNKRLKG